MSVLDPVRVPFLPDGFLDKYGYNELMACTRRPVNPSYRGRCFECRSSGVLWVDLKFRGFPRISNFLCDVCWDAKTSEEKSERRHQDTILFLRNRERRLARQRMGKKRW